MTTRQIGSLTKRQIRGSTSKSFGLILNKKNVNKKLINEILFEKLSGLRITVGKSELIKKALRGEKEGGDYLNLLATDPLILGEKRFFLTVALRILAEKGVKETVQGLTSIISDTGLYENQIQATLGLTKLARQGVNETFDGLNRAIDTCPKNVKILAIEGLKLLAKQKHPFAQTKLKKLGIQWE
jgi:hypothetical protein